VAIAVAGLQPMLVAPARELGRGPHAALRPAQRPGILGGPAPCHGRLEETEKPAPPLQLGEANFGALDELVRVRCIGRCDGNANRGADLDPVFTELNAALNSACIRFAIETWPTRTPTPHRRAVQRERRT
jgi:hypothetical protein